jgi:autotransporter translocation and assembly factor TamB
VLRGILAALGWTAAALAAALLAGVAFVHAPWGAPRLAGLVERVVSDRFEGDVSVGAASVAPWGVRVRDALVLDHRGLPVIAAREVDVVLDPVALLAGRLHVLDLGIRGGRVEISGAPVYDDVGIGVAFRPEVREIRRPRPGPPPPLPPPAPIPIDLDFLHFEDTAFRVAALPGDPSEILVRDLTGQIAGSWEDGARVRVHVFGTVLVPLEAPVEVDVLAGFADELLLAREVRIAVGGTRLRAEGRGQMRALDGTVRLAGTAGAAEARAFGIPLARDVDFAADFLLNRELLAGAFQATVPGAGEVAGEALLDPRDGTGRAAAAFAGLDPGAWIAGLPPGAVAGLVAAAGDLTPAPVLDVEFDLRRGTLAGEPFGPGHAAASLAGSHLRIDRARLAISGAGVDASGTLSPARVDGTVTLEARNLAATRRFLGALGIDLPDLRGRARATATVRGPPARPAVTLDLAAPRLGVGPATARDLRLRGSGRAGPDGLPALEVTARAARLEAGRFRGEELRLSARREPSGVFEVRARSGDRYLFRAGGRSGRARVVVEEFRFRYPEGRLHLEGPALVEPLPGGVALRELRLAGPGRLTGHVVLRRRDLDVDLEVRDLALSRLPQELVPADLEGRVELRARLAGPYAALRGTVRFRLSDGRVGPVAGLAASGRARLEGGRGRGRIALRLREAGVVRGSFDLPLDPARARASAPVALDLAGAPLELAAAGRALGATLPRGTLRFRLVAGGTVGSPRVRLDSQLLDVRLPDLPGADADLSLELAGGVAAVELQGRLAGRTVLRLDARAPLVPRRFLADPEGEARDLLRDPAVRIDGEARGLDLALVSRLLGLPGSSGPVAALVDLRGPLVDPRGRVRAEVAARIPGVVRRVDGTVEVDLGERRTRVEGGVSLEGGPFSTLAATVEASLTELLDGTAPPATEVDVAVRIPALVLRPEPEGRRRRRADLPAISSPDGWRPGLRLSGTIEGGGRFTGTLARLRGGLRVSGRDLALGDVPLGDAELSVTQGEALEVRLDAIDPTAGTLVAAARIGAEVSPARLLREGPPALEKLPAEVAVDGTALSLAPLRLVTAVAEARGRAALEFRALGPLGRLQRRGRLAVEGGRVELATGQVLEGIEAVAVLEGGRVELQQLQVRAPGRGAVEARGELVAGAKGARLDLVATARGFPVGGPGGVTARVTGEAEVEGALVDPDRGWNVEVAIPELRVDLPRRPPREVQPIARHRDVVIVTGREARRRIRRARVRQEARAIPVVVEIEAPNVRVSGEDVGALLAAELTLTREPHGEVAVTGAVRSRRATVRALGREFEVERAVVRFEGDPGRPFLDSTARYETREATAWVDVVGPADDPQVGLRSDPPLPESQIAVLIVSGRIPGLGPSPLEAGPVGERAPPPGAVEAGGAAASIAGAYLAGRLRQAIGPRLPLDVLVLESGGETGPRIEAGTYLGERLYVGFLRDLLPEEGENLNEIRAEYQLSPSFSLESFFGDAATGGVDLVWEKSVATGPQRAARRREAPGPGEGPAVAPGRGPGPAPRDFEPGRAPAAFPEDGGEPDATPPVGGAKTPENREDPAPGGAR